VIRYLEERSLQSSEAHIEARQSLWGGVFRDVTYFMGGSEMCDKV